MAPEARNYGTSVKSGISKYRLIRQLSLRQLKFGASNTKTRHKPHQLVTNQTFVKVAEVIITLAPQLNAFLDSFLVSCTLLRL